MTEDYCERDLVKQRLEIDAQDDSLDTKIDSSIAEASAVVENEMANIGGVPHPIPGIISHACADLAAAIYKQSLVPLAEMPLYQRGLDRIEQYKTRVNEAAGIPFLVGQDES